MVDHYRYLVAAKLYEEGEIELELVTEIRSELIAEIRRLYNRYRIGFRAGIITRARYLSLLRELLGQLREIKAIDEEVFK